MVFEEGQSFFPVRVGNLLCGCLFFVCRSFFCRRTSTVLQIIVGCFSLRISKEQTTTHPKVLHRPVAWSHMMPLSIVATSRGIGCRSGRVGVHAVECACAQTWVNIHPQKITRPFRLSTPVDRIAFHDY